MEFEITDEELRALPLETLRDLQQRIGVESYRRSVIAAAYESVEQANQVVLDGEGAKPGDPWRNPTTAAEAYPLNWVCSHGESSWLAVAGGTWEEPGTGDDWEVVPESEVEARTAAAPEAI